jgi:hypothetical protein
VIHAVYERIILEGPRFVGLRHLRRTGTDSRSRRRQTRHVTADGLEALKGAI